jgi:hypothetical protein
MSATPEDLLTRLRAHLGDEIGGRAWLILDEALSGERLYWPRSIGRALKARAVYEMRSGGRTIAEVADTLHLQRRTVERLYAAELRRRRRKNASELGKRDRAGAETESMEA